ncbi:phosphoenolpyruvate--protein phosphotransferase [Petrocella sp. FN5]|uniref:phosphoenolpyruvate--protein phosphotransferase n=1 Tax=Petrocella sp. FN5 TaxID=3032002 RepID=UPI0023DBB802|nr:phosphoenolpyruvate--protein phosphotransferase [Petrocella sp. FN5]MDF1616675.1 phosphoenolpyruvate--protein phosphotransferase [Petrocella sp. FN5]
MIRGIGVAEGVTIGKAFVKREVEMKVVYRKVENPQLELERFNTAVDKCRIELERRYNKTLNILGQEEAEVYKRHLSVYDGSILLGQVRKEIQEQKINADYILNEVKKKYAAMFDKVADDFLKKKSESIKYIAQQIIKDLIGEENKSLSDLTEPVIIFANELDGNDIVHLDKNRVLAIVCEQGGKTSYGALISNNFKIPAVLGAKGIMSLVKDGDEVIVDGQKGEVFINPDKEMIDFYFKKVNKEKELEDIFLSFTKQKTLTEDGHPFEIATETENNSALLMSKEKGAESIGLFKTEYIFLGQTSMPDELVQLEAYREAVMLAENTTIIFRMMDCSSNHDMPFIYFHEERNPLLGYRSLRITLTERILFITQIKALLRASAYGKMKILLPMVTKMEELLDAKMAIEEAKVELDARHELYDNNIEIGMMVEIPAAAMMIEVFAREVDFLVIGSSELIQLMTAVDRSNEDLYELFDMYHPGLLRTIRQVVIGAHREGTWISIVGDMANNEILLPFMIAIGVDQICVNPSMVPKVRWLASKTNKAIWENEIDYLLSLSSGNEIKEYLEKRYYENYVWS